RVANAARSGPYAASARQCNPRGRPTVRVLSVFVAGARLAHGLEARHGGGSLALGLDVGEGLLRGRREVRLTHDVVAIEDGAGAVPGDGHGHALGHAGADHVADGRAPHVVEELSRQPRTLAGRPPRLAEVADGLAVAVEDQRAVEAPRGGTALEQ